MSDIFFHNTLSGKKEKFVPLKTGEVKMYSCGPTVYDFAHIGNFRSFLVSDLLVRVLRYAGYKVTKVQNITDVGHLIADSDDGEDKILKKARLEKKDPFAIACFFEEAFVADEKILRILPPEFRPRATEYIPEQITLAENLIKRGFAYVVNGSVYFRTKKFKNYGALSGNKLKDLMAGARVEVNFEKEDPMDFALWKRAEENHLMQWKSPWGQGFPGWHAECSAMSTKLLGLPFDIHTGGEDNIFPHHECEIAQNECSSGISPSVRYWLHVKHLLVDGKKMSKSVGNFFTIRDLVEKGWKGEEIRYALLNAHYRSALNFTEESLAQARSSIARLEEARRIFGSVQIAAKTFSPLQEERERFHTALFDDLNVADALAVVFDLVREGMKLREQRKLTDEMAGAIVEFLDKDFNQIFDVLGGEKLSVKDQQKIEKMVAERNKFRAEKNWKESDRIRDELLQKFHVEIMDEQGKTSWKLKN